MGLLDIEVQGAGDRVVTGGDGLEGRLDALDLGALDLIGILIQEAEAEDAQGLRIGP